MLISEFDYELPAELIAQEPLRERAASRMLVVDRTANSFEDARFVDLSRLLRKGDVLVLNRRKRVSNAYEYTETLPSSDTVCV